MLNIKRSYLYLCIKFVTLCVGFAFFFFNLDSKGKHIAAFAVATSTEEIKNSPANDYLKKQLTQLEQHLAQLDTKLAGLESRLSQIELVVNKQKQSYNIPTSADSQKVVNDTNANVFTEADFGKWLDQSLNSASLDANKTQMMAAEAEKSLAVLPGVSMDDIQCAAEFCSANIISATGKPVDITQIFGASPYIGSGFTITEPDGNVKLYFTHPGQSLDDLRNEAQKSNLPTE